MERRTFFVGALSAVSLAALAACTFDPPVTGPTTAAPTPTPTPTSVVPRPAGFLRSAWSSDPESLGALSILPAGATPDDRDALSVNVGGRLFFAGEATSTEAPGTVLGARLSGLAAAAQLGALATAGERIAVIGAGMAGATAARALTGAGFDVVVIEARDRVGGRIRSVTERDWPFPVELGAGFLADDAVAVTLRARGIPLVPLDASTDTRLPTGVVQPPSTLGAAAVAEAVTWARKSNPEVSLAYALDATGALVQPTPASIGPSDAALVAHFLDTAVATAYGADPEGLSAAYGIERADDAARRLLVTGDVSSLIVGALEGLDVALSSPVVRVGLTDDGVSLRLGTGESMTVDRAIITVPIGVLQAGSIEFVPPLPSTLNLAINALGMGAVEQLWLRFDEPFWSSESTVLSVLGDTSVIAEWINLLPSTGEPILVGITAGADVAAVAAMSDGDFVDAALRTLVPFVDASLADPPVTPTPSGSAG